MAASRSWTRMVAMTGAALAVTSLLAMPVASDPSASASYGSEPDPASTMTTSTLSPSTTSPSTTTSTAVVANAMQDAAEADRPARRGQTMQVTDTAAPPVTALGDSLEIPADSGSGRRVIYSKTFMRVWLIEEDGIIFHTHRVSGLDAQPRPGTYQVWSRSERTCNRVSPDICMRFMVRFAFSFRGDNIGFHEIPRRNGVPLQDISELGLALSSGCVRQSTEDALVMWAWAQLGTVVVVLA